MSKTDPRRERVASRIAASQQRLKRDSDSLPARPRLEPLPDRDPPENYRSLAREYPWLTVAAGLGIGVLVAALLPRKFASKTAKRALGVATVAAELGLAYSRQARDAASEAAHDGFAKLEEGTAPLRQRAVTAGKTARNRGTRFAGEMIKAAARLRK
ncbi:MAG: hypothetical protein ACKOQM_01965 [Novosphingobium sp.]